LSGKPEEPSERYSLADQDTRQFTQIIDAMNYDKSLNMQSFNVLLKFLDIRIQDFDQRINVTRQEAIQNQARYFSKKPKYDKISHQIGQFNKGKTQVKKQIEAIIMYKS